MMRSIRQRALGIQPAETSLARRGFHLGDPSTRRRLERIGATFVLGYNAAIEEADPTGLATRLDEVELEFRGFAYEGAGMGLTILDALTPWRRWRLDSFLRGAASRHIYLTYVGAGWALARMRLRIGPYLERLDPVLRWLLVDGVGFHEGYFNWRRSFLRQEIPGRIRGYARNVFDQGLGRSLWFVSCAEPDRAVEMINGFPWHRRQDLWGGIGLAASYAGGADSQGLNYLSKAAGAYWRELAQGAAFAAKARQLAGNPATCTNLACEIFCGERASDAAWITDRALDQVKRDPSFHTDPQRNRPAYERWRQAIQIHFQFPKGLSCRVATPEALF
ncbi:MAG: DUF1702 family protein [Chloracidobacterium sp.]|nr:DUF1702 family protein [Chloracidobacterium sp.]